MAGFAFSRPVGSRYIGVPLVSSAPLFTSATAGSLRPMTLFMYTLPMVPKAFSISARHSAFAPQSSSKNGCFLPGMR